jgi:polysaccharide biosynthesis/export protein
MKQNKVSMFLLLMCSVLATSEMGRGQSAPAPDQASSAPAAKADESKTPIFAERHPRYKVMRSDILVLTFPLSTEFNQTVTVQPDGYISLLNSGSVYILGLTVPEVTTAVRNAYTGILKDPVVTVDLEDFQKPFFVVSGQVSKPGQFDLRYDLTATQGIALAGGLTPDAKGQAFLFHRVSNDWMSVKKIDIASIFSGKHLDEDIHLEPGDMIFVPTKFITKFKQYVPYTIGAFFNPSAALL